MFFTLIKLFVHAICISPFKMLDIFHHDQCFLHAKQAGAELCQAHAWQLGLAKNNIFAILTLLTQFDM